MTVVANGLALGRTPFEMWDLPIEQKAQQASLQAHETANASDVTDPLVTALDSRLTLTHKPTLDATGNLSWDDLRSVTPTAQEWAAGRRLPVTNPTQDSKDHLINEGFVATLVGDDIVYRPPTATEHAKRLRDESEVASIRRHNAMEHIAATLRGELTRRREIIETYALELRGKWAAEEAAQQATEEQRLVAHYFPEGRDTENYELPRPLWELDRETAPAKRRTTTTPKQEPINEAAPLDDALVNAIMECVEINPDPETKAGKTTIEERDVNSYWRRLVTIDGQTVTVWYKRPDTLAKQELSSDPDGGNEPLPYPLDCDYATFREAVRRGMGA